MCGGGGSSGSSREQALSSRVRQAELDMISRVNRGLEIRRLLTPEEIAARQLELVGEPRYGTGSGHSMGSIVRASLEDKAAKSEDPTF